MTVCLKTKVLTAGYNNGNTRVHFGLVTNRRSEVYILNVSAQRDCRANFFSLQLPEFYNYMADLIPQ
jgi:hypothetical protein